MASNTKRTRSFEFDQIVKFAGLRFSDASAKDQSRKNFSNFLQSASDRMAGNIYDFYKREVANERFVRSAPIYIQKAVELAYGYVLPDGPKDDFLHDVVSQIADRKAETTTSTIDFLENLSVSFSGIWDVVRYSARDEPNAPSAPEGFLMRLAMEIEPRGAPGHFPRFTVRYRPGVEADSTAYRISKGIVMSIGGGAHMLFFGYEEFSKYPLLIIANQERRNSKHLGSFTGLVLRRHEKGHIIAARVFFCRSVAKSLDELTSKIDMYSESELRESFADEHPKIKFDKLVDAIVNKVGNAGKSALWL
jgi:hypothetical protein